MVLDLVYKIQMICLNEDLKIMSGNQMLDERTGVKVNARCLAAGHKNERLVVPDITFTSNISTTAEI